MRILLVSNMYPSNKYPHYGIFVKNTADVLEKNGFKVSRVYMHKQDGKIAKLFAYMFFYLKTFIMYFISFPDVIYVHYASLSSLPVIIAEKIKKKKLVVNVHGNDLVPETNNDYKYIKYTKTILNIANQVICPSEYFQEILISKYNIASRKVIVYPSGGVDTELFKKIDKKIACEKLNLPIDYDYIGYVGRIEHGKGWDLFLESCSIIIKNDNNFRLIVVGSGSEEELYNKKVNKLQLNNYIYKFSLLGHDKLKYAYNSLSLFMFLSSRKSESLGLVGLEAMACETVAILPNKYGPTSYGINDVNCYFFEVGNKESLNKTIRRALMKDNKIISKNARLTAKKYDSNICSDILINTFKDLY